MNAISRPVATAVPSLWAPLRIAAFRALWFAQLGTMLGVWMQTVGAQWLLVARPDSAALVALVQVASMVPMLLFALPAGALADIMDRRRLLIGVQLFQLAGRRLAQRSDGRGPDAAGAAAHLHLPARGLPDRQCARLSGPGAGVRAPRAGADGRRARWRGHQRGPRRRACARRGVAGAGRCGRRLRRHRGVGAGLRRGVAPHPHGPRRRPFCRPSGSPALCAPAGGMCATRRR